MRPHKPCRVAVAVAVHLLGVCTCRTSSCPAELEGTRGSALLQLNTGQSVQRQSAQSHSASSDSLYILVTAGIKVLDTAVTMQASMLRRLRPQDRYAHICEVGCAAMSNGTLHNVVEMDPSVFSAGLCLSPEWREDMSLRECSDYLQAQMKFVYGLVHMVRLMKKDGAEMPGWWLVKDDDTYAHVPNLVKTIKRYSPADLVSFAEVSCQGICGGAGWLLSNALAERLALDHGDRWIQLMDFKLRHTPLWSLDVFYDVYIPTVVSWVPGAQLLWHLGMQNQSPFDHQCNSTMYKGVHWVEEKFDVENQSNQTPYFHGPDWQTVVRPFPEWHQINGTCFSSKACACAYSAFPVTWHLEAARHKGLFKEAIALLDLDSPFYKAQAAKSCQSRILSVLLLILAITSELPIGSRAR